MFTVNQFLANLLVFIFVIFVLQMQTCSKDAHILYSCCFFAREKCENYVARTLPLVYSTQKTIKTLPLLQLHTENFRWSFIMFQSKLQLQTVYVFYKKIITKYKQRPLSQSLVFHGSREEFGDDVLDILCRWFFLVDDVLLLLWDVGQHQLGQVIFTDLEELDKVVCKLILNGRKADNCILQFFLL